MIAGFSKLSQQEKIDYLIKERGLSHHATELLINHHHPELQETYNQFSENTISNFYLPLGIAPNFVINSKWYDLPMVTEESSVVAAAAKAAKFWSERGGFKTKVISTLKKGQLFFKADWSFYELSTLLPQIEDKLKQSVAELTTSMEKRGGGIRDIDLDQIELKTGTTYALDVYFETADAMGANFINSCLEKMGDSLHHLLQIHNPNKSVEIIMAILSNYTPDCLVECTVTCSLDELKPYAADFSAREFANRFKHAVDIATRNTSRAVTHNKGIMNGIDAVIIATGNDFRAIEAGAHAYASRNGKYASLSQAEIKDDIFSFSLCLPLAVGTIGGLTSIHPMAKIALEILGNPSAKDLMQIAAASGLANNFSAVAALVTSGIQKGHMKMHLSNILQTLGAEQDEIEQAENYFKDKQVSHSLVKAFIKSLRN
ncbi:hydroxymethylglutaryl-CoA reductase, degradative [Plebeiibacterium marinum]|uniref:3-hydroxy-3-methylglutaryl coenzyme A reductase n=1 Tax=Plebeiibacterium marinum TaxID=2992111 RepID=A0AAE3MF56_9BACT|nr:hydroxymethylglutaryl-CoA reductase, degradative [Plebeiobacterium marinum]MCW3806838.1 hydroxymethylglutaryl-CoA reductase, degradative [Plebeiobacterium marinum]